MTRHPTRTLAAAFALLTVAAPLRAQGLPDRISDAEFWHLVTDLSEPGGFFRSENFVGNETTLQHVLPRLTEQVRPGGVYLGVGPDQNFTYVVALRPRVAFVVDIRRQNMLQLLLYKALIETSADRVEFLSRLFARPRPPGLSTGASAETLFAAYRTVVRDSAYGARIGREIRAQLVDRHGFALAPQDLATIDYVYGAFVSAGPDINYSYLPGSPASPGWGRMPTYEQMLSETDEAGVHRSYLAGEECYQYLRVMELENRIVPLVGDFSGPKTLRAVGQWLREHQATVSAFYTSNVEQYLFRQNDDWKKFFSNVETMPLDASSTFVRAVFNFGGYPYQIASPSPSDSTRASRIAYGARSATLLAPIIETVRAVSEGRVTSYGDVIQMSK